MKVTEVKPDANGNIGGLKAGLRYFLVETDGTASVKADLLAPATVAQAKIRQVVQIASITATAATPVAPAPAPAPAPTPAPAQPATPAPAAPTTK
jgi:hypothetical protein